MKSMKPSTKVVSYLDTPLELVREISEQQEVPSAKTKFRDEYLEWMRNEISKENSSLPLSKIDSMMSAQSFDPESPTLLKVNCL